MYHLSSVNHGWKILCALQDLLDLGKLGRIYELSDFKHLKPGPLGRSLSQVHILDLAPRFRPQLCNREEEEVLIGVITKLALLCNVSLHGRKHGQ